LEKEEKEEEEKEREKKGREKKKRSQVDIYELMGATPGKPCPMTVKRGAQQPPHRPQRRPSHRTPLL
jgi:hypothetical protein